MDKSAGARTTDVQNTTVEVGEMRASTFREVRPMFLIAVSRETLTLAETPIPRAFIRKYGKGVENIINLCFRNGDVYQCRICKSRSTLLGMLKIFKRWGVEACSILLFEQITVADFMVIVVAPMATEIIYPGEGIYQPYQKEVSQILPAATINSIPTAEGVKVNQNWAMAFWAAKEQPDRTINFVYNGDDVEIEDNQVLQMQFGREEGLVWPDGSCIFLNIGGQLQRVRIKRIGSIARLGMGWDVVLQALNIKEGDYIVMVEAGNPYHFHLNVYTDYRKIQRQTFEGRIKPENFIKIVTHKFLSSGEMVIPRMFWPISDSSLKQRLGIIITGGRRFECQHQVETHKLVGLQNFIHITGVEESDLLHFRYVNVSSLAVTLFNKAAVKFKGRLPFK